MLGFFRDFMKKSGCAVFWRRLERPPHGIHSFAKRKREVVFRKAASRCKHRLDKDLLTLRRIVRALDPVAKSEIENALDATPYGS